MMVNYVKWNSVIFLCDRMACHTKCAKGQKRWRTVTQHFWSNLSSSLKKRSFTLVVDYAKNLHGLLVYLPHKEQKSAIWKYISQLQSWALVKGTRGWQSSQLASLCHCDLNKVKMWIMSERFITSLATLQSAPPTWRFLNISTPTRGWRNHNNPLGGSIALEVKLYSVDQLLLAWTTSESCSCFSHIPRNSGRGGYGVWVRLNLIV